MLDNKPKDVEVIRRLVGGLTALGRLEEADSLYCRAIDHLRSDESLFNDYGNFLSGLGMYGRAAEIYRRALKINPNNCTRIE